MAARQGTCAGRQGGCTGVLARLYAALSRSTVALAQQRLAWDPVHPAAAFEAHLPPTANSTHLFAGCLTSMLSRPCGRGRAGATIQPWRTPDTAARNHADSPGPRARAAHPAPRTCQQSLPWHRCHPSQRHPEQSPATRAIGRSNQRVWPSAASPTHDEKHYTTKGIERRSELAWESKKAHFFLRGLAGHSPWSCYWLL